MTIPWKHACPGTLSLNTGTGNYTEFDFILINNLVIVPVKVNGSASLNFILDSGVGNIFLTSRGLADTLHIPDGFPINIAGAGGQKTMKAWSSRIDSFSMPGISGCEIPVVVLDLDHLQLESYLGIPVHGLVGYDVFSLGPVEIDYFKRKVRLHHPGRFRKPQGYSTMKLIVENQKPYINALLHLYDTTVINARLMLDIGASHAVLLETNSDPRIILPEPHLNSVIGLGLGGEINGSFARIRSLHLDKHRFNNPIASFTDSYSTGEYFNRSGRHGTLGGELLSRFNVIIDYRAHRLLLQRNAYYPQAFEHDMSGIEIRSEGSMLRLYRIRKVLSGSPAEAAGLQADDIIISINGYRFNRMCPDEMLRLLRMRHGKTIRMKVLRYGEILKIRFKLARMV